MEILWETVAFSTKALVVVLSVTATVVIVMMATRRGKGGSDSILEITRLNERLKRLRDTVRRATMEAKDFKAYRKKRGKVEKKQDKPERNVYVLDFKGDIMAHAVESLRQEITSIIDIATPQDEVVVRVESPGGAVSHYGLAASQLARLRERNIPLTVCIDRMAASGGYMMAVVADTIVAAPFAVVGSIGVVAQVPNVHRLLKDHGVDYEDMTAGEYKRTVSVFGEITPKGREKFQEQIEEVHGLFKEFIKSNRPDVDLDVVATGEHWLATRGKELGLVNELMTSDDYLLGKIDSANVYKLAFKAPTKLKDRLVSSIGESMEHAISRLIDRVNAVRFT